ncbi:DUF2304 domain-containing protein [Aurantimicrobium minutum]|uniref:DUF2304 domain-containing protein n=1 Tax=Aurantimicrobium minutum TaxID=708131 RepID=UPI00247402D2|nr:DUF2304 domain-containing protein [Aurantimicrobium minutum]MDH6208273.1 hypothetical protein [Aurantimicrobium minutum]
MTTVSQIIGIIAAVLTLLVVIEMVRRGQLKERHALWWLVAGILALIIGIFPDLLNGVADAVGVEVPINLVFFVSIAVLFLVCIQSSSELTSLEEKTRILAEESALLRQKIEELEKKINS